MGSTRIKGWLKGLAVGTAFAAMVAVPMVGQDGGKTTFDDMAHGAGKVIFQDAAQGQGKVSFQDLFSSNVSQQESHVATSTGKVIKKATLY